MAKVTMKEPTVVAMLGLGEAGTALAAGLMGEWRGADASRRVIAVDTALGDNLRGAAIQDRARDLGVAIEGRSGIAGAIAQAQTRQTFTLLACEIGDNAYDGRI